MARWRCPECNKTRRRCRCNDAKPHGGLTDEDLVSYEVFRDGQAAENAEIVFKVPRGTLHYAGVSQMPGKLNGETCAAFVRTEDRDLFLAAMQLQWAIKRRDSAAAKEALAKIGALPV